MPDDEHGTPADPGSVVDALTRALTAAKLPAKHEATISLAYRYAETIDDDASSLTKIGPLLLATLDALGLNKTVNAVATPREGVPGAGTSEPTPAAPPSTLQLLRDAARERRTR